MASFPPGGWPKNHMTTAQVHQHFDMWTAVYLQLCDILSWIFHVQVGLISLRLIHPRFCKFHNKPLLSFLFLGDGDQIPTPLRFVCQSFEKVRRNKLLTKSEKQSEHVIDHNVWHLIWRVNIPELGLKWTIICVWSWFYQAPVSFPFTNSMT